MKKLSKPSIAGIVTVIIIAAAGAAAWYFYNESQKSGFVKGAEATENWAQGVGKAISGK